MSLPKDFLWGGATAANQYEGGWNIGRRGKSSDDVIFRPLSCSLGFLW